MIIQVYSNSMIFPCMELFLVIFQVFHEVIKLFPLNVMINLIDRLIVMDFGKILLSFLIG